MNTKAIDKALALGRFGSGLKSSFALTAIGILSQAANWKRLNIFLKFALKLFKKGAHLKLKLKRDSRQANCMLRFGNNADYQGLFECYAGMYQLPETPIKFILDGGANIGFFSSYAYLTQPSVQQIICIEPNPDNLPVLKANLQNIPATIVNKALSDFSGTAVFNFKEHNTGHIEGSPGHAYHFEQTTVSCCTISEIIPPEWDMQTTLIKLDIEGQEYNVFKDMLAKKIYPKLIAAELHDYFHAGGPELIQAFEQHGYTVQVEGSGNEGNVCRQIVASRKTVS
jgi:FkbM family methyltransferase